MKKKVAVFATGWSSQILYDYLQGLRDGLSQASTDIYVFMSFPSIGDTPEFLQGELNIFNLPNLKDFEAVFAVANGLDFPELISGINQKSKDAGIPIIYTGHDDGENYFVGADNYFGAKELSKHLIYEHHVEDIFFIAGTKENQDSNDRLDALLDVLKEKGQTLSDDQILYSNWDPMTTITFVRKWVKSGKKLPEAFVCANDKLALMVCSELRAGNIRVPEDVLVTGFDNEFLAQIHDPSISSVNQRFDKIGQKCAQIYLDITDKKEVERKSIVHCEFVPSESCGCINARDFGQLRREVGRNSFLDRMNSSAFHRKLSMLERGIMQGTCYSDIKTNLSYMIGSYNNYEGDSFHLVLDPIFEEIITDPTKQLRTDSYPEIMDAIYSKDGEEVHSFNDFKSSRIVPFIADDSKNHLFVCLPLHDNGKSLGYVIFGDDIEKVNDGESLQKYQERLSIVLSKFLQTLSIDVLNHKLLELSETDVLTHVKNRTAYQSKENLINKSIASKSLSSFAVIIFDINNLKQINDNLGHEAGDKYIINSCKLICDVFKRSCVYRIGGDEFAILLEGADYDNRYELMYEFNKRIQAIQDSDVPDYEKVSIAGGLSEFNPSTDCLVSDVLTRADELMYERKQAMKKKMELKG